MNVIRRILKSRKYRGLQIATAVFDDGSQLLLTNKPEAGEPIEAKVRRIKTAAAAKAWIPAETNTWLDCFNCGTPMSSKSKSICHHCGWQSP